MKILFTITLLFSSVISYSQSSHSAFDQLLKRHVDQDGGVNYDGFYSDSDHLDSYLLSLSLSVPEDTWTREEKLAYWINAYNALTIQLILKHHPVQSMKDIGSDIEKGIFEIPWDIACFELNGEKLSLNIIEHDIIRKNFVEPRIHFAIVSAAVSCPKLRTEAYRSNILDQQLTDQTRNFLKDERKNKISEDQLELSKVFNWYGDDFNTHGTIIEFVDAYTSVSINKDANTTYLDFDWSLNSQ